MTKEEYLVYIDHFNNKRYDALTEYFTSDITIEYPTTLSITDTRPLTLSGPVAFVEFYRTLHSYVDEYLELGDFICDGKLLFAELYTEFYCFQTTPAGKVFGNWQKGEMRIMTNWVLYNLDRGKFRRIRIAHFRMHDPSKAKYLPKNAK